MKKIYVIGALIAAMALGAGAVSAATTFTSATGGVALPDVKTVPANNLDVALVYHNQELNNSDPATHAIATYGVDNNIEFGLKNTWQGGNGNPNLDNWGASVKCALPVKLIDLNLASGAIYQKYDKFSTELYQFYAVGGSTVWKSYEDNRSLDFNVGINWTKFQTTGYKTDKFRLFTVLDYKCRDDIDLIGEYQTEASGLDVDPLCSLALRYQMDENLTWQIGITNAFRGVIGSGQHDLFIGANYRFTSFSEK